MTTVSTWFPEWTSSSSKVTTTVSRPEVKSEEASRVGNRAFNQLSATVNYVITLPTPPNAGPDPGVLDLWDEGLWDDAEWDAGTPPAPTIRNTGWVSIGQTGFSHAPIVQVTVAQQARPEVDLISIAATFERAGINV